MLRPATDNDSVNVLRWRNHPEVRAVSLTQHEISEEEHRAWWAATMKNPTRQILIYERSGVASGVVTFFDLDTTHRSGWWGYYLDNDGLNAAGALFPAWIQIQRDAVKYAGRNLNLTELHAETLAANEAVRDFNARAGFEEIETYSRVIGEQEHEVIHTVKRFEESA